MKIINPSVEYIPQSNNTLKGIYEQIEKAGRTCYKSNVLGEDSYKKFINNIIGNGHESVIEHEKVTVVIGCDVGAYKDITRSRLYLMILVLIINHPSIIALI